MAWRIQATFASAKNPDFVYTLATIGLISGLELWLGIIVVCMPTIPPILQAYVRPAFQKLASYYRSRRSRGDASGNSKKDVINSDGSGQKFRPQGLSDDIQLGGYGGQSWNGGGGHLVAEASSLGHQREGAFGRALRGETSNSSPYVTVDDDTRTLWAAGDSSASVAANPKPGPPERLNWIYVQHHVDQSEDYIPVR